ncbi:hypothetical protein UA08_04390 [Talaromyces atroroseus]|uniref:Ubiquinol-cytochrome c chaperone domain-containing protein n=1 Tax=Talaromyces atroroseus TaxID=1441469 RepID=A0A1Q5Q9B4_TALAT|nr:hypothetical protein UA08_04390 [Talaromyces atroroseus]OKL60723.1 hypothetical protein UA08_04390 [Talaromyces atroroseus]
MATDTTTEAQMPPPPQTFVRKGFTITTQKLPILKAAPIEAMANKLGITPPEMIFGDNFVAIDHNASGWGISFNAYDALDRVDKTGAAMLKVAYSKEWQKSREHTHEGIKEVVKPFDWSYSTDYKGTLRSDAAALSSSDVQIPIELLKRPDPILFFDDVVLYEDELADNGISMLSCKIRVMPDRLLLLARFFMRLDNVVFRLRDTRIYVDFNKAEIIRDYQAREMGYEDVRKALVTGREDIAAIMRDPNRLAQILPLVDIQFNCHVKKTTVSYLLFELTLWRNRERTGIVLYPILVKCWLSQLINPHKQYKSVHTRSLSLAAHRRYDDTWKDSSSSLLGRSEDCASQCQPNLRPSARRNFSATTAAPSGILNSLASRKGGAAETYVSYGFTQKLYEACSSPADYRIPQLAQKGAEIPKTASGEDLGVGEGWWYKDLDLPPTFSTWSQVTFLHMYLLTVRLRALPSIESVRTHSRHLVDHFSLNAEERMATLHNISSRSIRNKYLKDLFIQWRGVVAAYDEGLVKGDAVLGAAVWRNIWKASATTHDGQELDWSQIATVVAYMRRVLSELSEMSEADLVFGVEGAGGKGKKSSIFGFHEIDLKLAGRK